MDWGFFRELLAFSSPSGRERPLAEWLCGKLRAPQVRPMEVGDGTLNLLCLWSETPQVVFCTHLDTVPPSEGQRVSPFPDQPAPEAPILGRGACDAKGQIFAQYEACLRLAAAGRKDFALLLLSGEETGSHGAKAFAKTDFRAPWLIVGEPTENHLASAAKGTKAYRLSFAGKEAHSGYPQLGQSAVTAFLDFCDRLRGKDFGRDDLLGETTWNIGELHSGNPQNVLSPQLTARLYFRTTFASDTAVTAWMAGCEAAFPTLAAECLGGDAPMRYDVPEGFPSAPIAFGSDAPHLVGFAHKMLCGPGSIRHAHRADEQILPRELEEAVALYVRLYDKIVGEKR